MIHTLKFMLTRAAVGKGGDRYEAYVKEQDKPVVIYIPQYISRENQNLATSVAIAFDPVHETD